jgi:hypothetical protein
MKLKMSKRSKIGAQIKAAADLQLGAHVRLSVVPEAVDGMSFVPHATVDG